MRISPEVLSALREANPNLVFSLDAVVAVGVPVVFCGCCEACRPADHDCCPLPPVDDVSVAVLDRVCARTAAAPARFNGGREPA